MILYNILEDKSNAKKVDINLIYELKLQNEPITDVFALSGLIFLCVGNQIQGYEIIMRDDKVFEARSKYQLNTEKVAFSTMM